MITNDAAWIEKIIDSCCTPFQLAAADKMIEFFIKRYHQQETVELHTDRLTTQLQVKHASMVAGMQ